MEKPGIANSASVNEQVETTQPGLSQKSGNPTPQIEPTLNQPAAPGYAPPPYQQGHGYPAPHGSSYPAQSYPPQGQGYPASGYPPAQGYPPPGPGYPAAGYPHPTGGFAPPVGFQQQHNTTIVVTQPMETQPITGAPPPDPMYAAILMTLCCFFPTGIFAIVRANDARKALARGDVTSAHTLASSAKRLVTISLIVGLVIYSIFVFYYWLN